MRNLSDCQNYSYVPNTLDAIIVLDSFNLAASVLSCLCFFGVVTNTMNVIVFSHRDKLKNNIYRYFLWHSLVDLVYLTICFIRFVIKSETLHSIHYNYWTQIFDAYAYKYLASSLAILMIFIELIIAIKRLLIITNTNITFKLRLRTVVMIATLAAIGTFLPLGLFIKVVDEKYVSWELKNSVGQTKIISYYVVIYEQNSSIHKTLISWGAIFRAIVAPLMLIIANITIMIKFRQVFNRKKWLMSKASRSRKRNLFESSFRLRISLSFSYSDFLL